MARSGNRLGPRAVYQYTTDGGIEINLLLDDDLVLTNSGLIFGDDGTTAPKRFKPRVVFAQASVDGKIARKAFVCGSPTAPLYVANAPQTITLDGLTFVTTGRRGETQTFIGNAVGGPAAP